MHTPTTRKYPLRRAATAVCVAVALAATAASHAGPSPSDYTKTRYPVVLVHGLLGFSQIGPLDYFYGLPQALRDGGSTVYAPAVSAANSNEVRGEQLLQTLRQLKAAYGYTKFNLIGHSQGAPTARYVAAVAPDLVASVTTMGGAQGPSKLADTAISAAQNPQVASLITSIVNGLAGLISQLGGRSDLPQNATAAFGSLSTAGTADFNRRFPQGAPTTACGQGPELVGGVRYFSATGTSVLTNPLDLSDLVLGLASTLYSGEANDGLVSRCASHWGTVIKDDFPWNHLDEVNQIAGLRGVFTPDPVAFYRGQVNRLKGLGL